MYLFMIFFFNKTNAQNHLEVAKLLAIYVHFQNTRNILSAIRALVGALNKYESNGDCWTFYPSFLVNWSEPESDLSLYHDQRLNHV